jgi:hypothetical protein
MENGSLGEGFLDRALFRFSIDLSTSKAPTSDPSELGQTGRSASWLVA